MILKTDNISQTIVLDVEQFIRDDLYGATIGKFLRKNPDFMYDDNIIYGNLCLSRTFAKTHDWINLKFLLYV
jgi:hypothetical protein